MRFSQTTTNDGIVQGITFTTGLDTIAIDTKERARLVNKWHYKCAMIAWENDPDWQFDDPNIATSQSDQGWTYDATFVGLPRATRDLTDNIRMYRLPTNALEVERVEIQKADGNWYVINRIQEHNIPRVNTSDGQSNFAVPEFYETKGLPRVYNLVGTNIELFPAPDSSEVTTTAGVKIYVQRTMDRFVSTDDAQEPAIPEPFQEILILGPSFDIALAKGLENARSLKREVEQMLFEMQKYYTNRNRHSKNYIMVGKNNPI